MTEPIHYELHIDTSNAALARFAAALLTTPCTLSPRKLRFSGALGRGVTQCLMIEFPDKNAMRQFKDICRPQEMQLARVATPGGGMRAQCPAKGEP